MEVKSVIKSYIEKILQESIFEFNDNQNRLEIKKKIEEFINSMSPLVWENPNYWIICDETNNPLEVINDNGLNVDVYLYGNETVCISAAARRTGISFEEIRILD